MPVDFTDDESRRQYLLEKFDDLLTGINNQYGKELMDELITRLEKTVNIFHQEVQNLIVELKQAYQRKETRLRDVDFSPKQTSVAPEDEPEEKSEWEKKLEERLMKKYQSNS